MVASLDGKWMWIWNWPRCDGGDPVRVAARLKAADCTGAIVKAHDGPRWRVGSFDQGRPWQESANALKAHGLRVGGWGYFYGEDPVGEADRASETVHYGGAELYVLDVEGELKGRPEAAEAICLRIRQAVGPEYPLYYSSYAIARYHRDFPFQVFNRHCTGAAPQVYWNAFRWPVEQALGRMYDDYGALGLPPEQVFPVAGLYQERGVDYPTAQATRAFAEIATARGCRGVSFWSYEHMDEEMWRAVATLPWADAPGEEGLSVSQYEQLSARIAALEGRIGVLESHFRQSTPPQAHYHVVGAEGARGLWGVAEHLGVPEAQIPTWIAQVKALNGFTAENPIIHQGDRLRIP